MDESIEVTMAKFKARMEARAERPRNARGQLLGRHSPNRGLYDAAILREPLGRDDEAELWVCYNGMRDESKRLNEIIPGYFDDRRHIIDPDALNGYVAFSKRHAPSLPKGDDNILMYIPVHGGITYNCKDSFAAVWGFDTMHCDSMNVDRTNPDYIRYQCHVLYTGLKVCAELWPRFRRERDLDKRVAMAQSVRDIDPATTEGMGFTALINLLQGRIG